MHLRNLADHRKTFIGAVSIGRQSQVDQRQCRGIGHVVDQIETRGAVAGAFDIIFIAEHILEAIGDNGIIVDQQQCRFFFTVQWHAC